MFLRMSQAATIGAWKSDTRDSPNRRHAIQSPTQRLVRFNGLDVESDRSFGRNGYYPAHKTLLRGYAEAD